MAKLLITMSMIAMLASPLTAATYHVDGETGADASSGLTPGQAWKSLDRVNRQVFKPGDAIRFKAGTHYSGQFKPRNSGELSAGKPTPIVVGKYGEGPRPGSTARARSSTRSCCATSSTGKSRIWR